MSGINVGKVGRTRNGSFLAERRGDRDGNGRASRFCLLRT
jgi:hypothetical protein